MRPAVTLAACASGICSVCALPAELQAGEGPLEEVARVWVAPLWPPRLEMLAPTTPSVFAAEPSQYLSWLAVALSQVLPLSEPVSGVAINVVSWASLKAPNINVFCAFSATLPTLDRSKPP